MDQPVCSPWLQLLTFCLSHFCAFSPSSHKSVLIALWNVRAHLSSFHDFGSDCSGMYQLQWPAIGVFLATNSFALCMICLSDLRFLWCILSAWTSMLIFLLDFEPPLLRVRPPLPQYLQSLTIQLSSLQLFALLLILLPTCYAHSSLNPVRLILEPDGGWLRRFRCFCLW